MGLLLPYRTGAPDLAAWLGARARGRVTAPADSGAAKAAEGAATTAAALGLADGRGELTAAGRRFALAPEPERRRILREAVLGFEPYAELLEAVRSRGDAATEAQWIETWWATRGYGGSASNRREGVATFGRLVDWLGLGRYVPGRRGHATRLEWAEGALEPEEALPSVTPGATSAPEAPEAPEERVVTVEGPAPESEQRSAVESGPAEVNRLVVPLGGGRVARLEVPARLPREEKRRLLDLLELLIAEI